MNCNRPIQQKRRVRLRCKKSLANAQRKTNQSRKMREYVGWKICRYDTSDPSTSFLLYHLLAERKASFLFRERKALFAYGVFVPCC